METASAQKRKGRRPEHLFAGLVFCGCGKKMYVPSNSPKYTCQACRTKIPESDLEHLFEVNIKNFFISTDEIERYVTSATEHGKTLEERLAVVGKELENVSRKTDRLIELYSEGALSRDAFQSRFEPLEIQKTALQAEEVNLTAQVDLIRIDALSVDHIRREGHDLFGRWQSLPFEQKRPIVESFCNQIVINGDKSVNISLVYFPSLKELAKSQRMVRDS
jgi:site-specific DNA recombinase